jgi:hypothetical protein
VKRTAFVLLLALLAGGSTLLTTGCSSFDRDFEALRLEGVSSSGVSDLTGRWEGTWQSDENGHTGSLRCIITRKDSDYLARYYATYTWCFLPLSFEMAIPTTAQPEGPAKAPGGAWKLRGSAELSCWVAGGLYEYEARVEGGEYVATYRSSFDRGVFRLQRVP